MQLRDKHGQVRMTETIAVLFIFFVLILFGIIFYYKYQQVAIKDKQEELLAARAMESTLKALYLPELICSKGEAEPEENCLDVLKLQGTNKTFHDHLTDYYFDIFSYGKITVFEVYPSSENAWVIYDKAKEDYEKKESTYFVVSLKDDTKNALESYYSYGYMKVEVYS